MLDDIQQRSARIQTPLWRRLGERTRTMLQRVNESILLREADLIALAWPEPVSRQAQEEALTRWQQRRYIQQLVEGAERCYQLDIVGAKVLRNAGFTQIAPTRPLMPRARPGVLLANRLGTSLIIGAQHDPQVTGVAWLAQPFSGNTARPDGVATIQYRVAAQPGVEMRRALWLPAITAEGYAPPPGEALQRLVVEIDSGTESQRQLIQRAKAWRTRWEAMPHLPATNTLILWLTTGTIERLNTIWEAWIGHAFLPAFFATQSDLDADIPHWRPWEPLRFTQGRYHWLWRDLYGRPRSLKPWEMREPLWRTEALQPVTLPSLAASIAEWERVCPAPGF
ncbi:MAG: hypothetical protein HXY37_06235 [Chloroflexi bacterium]|nr:hypothetical protein [Chloroflexota bacterium]